MEVISHRGYWKTPDEKNGLVAFDRSFALGFGTETDIRDHDGRLVISHDMPIDRPMPIEVYLDSLKRKATKPLLQALNIKADGQAELLAKALAGVQHPWFVFDMSIPDTLQHLKVGNPVYARMSEYEPFPEALKSRIKGIWLDGFEGIWYSADTIRGLLDQGLGVCVVSPELHKRADYADFWRSLIPFRDHPGLSLCSDLPEEAVATIWA